MDRSRSPCRPNGSADGAPTAPAAASTGPGQKASNFPFLPRWCGPTSVRVGSYGGYNLGFRKLCKFYFPILRSKL